MTTYYGPRLCGWCRYTVVSFGERCCRCNQPCDHRLWTWGTIPPNPLRGMFEHMHDELPRNRAAMYVFQGLEPFFPPEYDIVFERESDDWDFLLS